MNPENGQKQLIDSVLVHGGARNNRDIALNSWVYHKAFACDHRNLGHEFADIGIF